MTAASAAGRPALTGYTLAMNYLPALYLVTGVLLGSWLPSLASRLVFAGLWVYLVPPAIGRLAVAVAGDPRGRGLRQHSRAYRVWWLLFQLQAPFNRLPWIEELLRLVPGAYATWLNCWGARVSLFAYWGPGARVLDRSLVRVGCGAVIGAQAALTGHLATRADDGAFVVDVDVVVVEAGAMVGARAGLGPGCRVKAGELLTAGRLLAPFSTWDAGRKARAGVQAP